MMRSVEDKLPKLENELNETTSKFNDLQGDYSLLGRKHDNMKLDLETTREILRDTKEYEAFCSMGSDFYFLLALCLEQQRRLLDSTTRLMRC